jgi:magnesium transporter
MKPLFGKFSRKAGLAPGTLVHVGEQKVDRPRITVIDYDGQDFTERQVQSCEECAGLKDLKTVSWINIDGLHDTKLIGDIGAHFGLHPLVLEDILNTHQRPKIDDYDDYLFAVLRMISFDEKKDAVQSEQVSLVLGKRFVLTFQERPGDVFDPVRERIRKAKGRVRKEGADYLAYALLDAIVDNYFLVLENVSNRIEALEESVTRRPTTRNLQEIHRLRSGVGALRRSIWPLREILGALSKNGARLIDDHVEPYLRDLYDHAIQVTDAIETFREMLSGLQDLYMSGVSNRMNEVMKVLTIFAAIFIPLTFIAGVYGMNFEYMPELKWRWGYPAVLALMTGVAVTMLGFFRARGWFGSGRRRGER